MDQAKFLEQLQDHAKKHGNDTTVHYFIGYTKAEITSDKPSVKALKAMYAAYYEFQDQSASQHIPGYGSLTQEQKQLFERVHKKHRDSWETAVDSVKYAKFKIINLLWDAEENCLKVYYNDVWWHYDTKGDWY